MSPDHSDPSSTPLVKYTEHVVVTKKTEKARLAPGSHLLQRRLVRITFTDPHATDSSSSEDEDERRTRLRMKRHVTEIDFQCASPPRRRTPQFKHMQIKQQQQLPAPPRPVSGDSPGKKFRGVRLRPWGRWSAEIRDPKQPRKRLWLGTFDTAEEAASVYDSAALRLQGNNAVTNFSPGKHVRDPVPIPPPIATESTRDESNESPFPSPTSVLHYGELTPLDYCSGYGDVDAFGLSVDLPPMAFAGTDFYTPKKHRWGEEEEFGDLNAEDFVLGF